ncbi:MAG: hypothetical protein AAGC68_04775 [Verrucomicrobiota bacterium]
MKESIRYLILAFAVIAVIAIMVVWKKNDREAAFEDLRTRFDAEISITEEDFYVGCSSERLVDLIEFSRGLERAGEPTILDLTGAPKLETLAGIGRLITLHSVIAIDCPSLVSASGVARHPKLRELVFTESASLADISDVREIKTLETLDLSGCVELGAVPVEELPSLENLYLSRCRRVELLDVTPFPTLRQLYLDGCAGLVELNGLGKLSELTDLDLSNSTALNQINGIENLENLVVLDLRNVALSDFSGVGSLPSLRVLRMGGQESIETLEVFSGLSELREIHLEACANLRSLKGIPSTVSQYAGFTHCPQLQSIEGIEGATNLEQLDLTGCENLDDIAPVKALENLVQLSLVNCRKVTDLEPVEALEKLVIVMLGGSGVVPAAVESLDPANEEIIFDFAVSN